MLQNDASLLFDDEFTILTVDAPTKKFDRVSRVTASSSDKNMELVLDIHNEQYPLLAGTKITLALAKSLTQEGEKGGGAEAQSWRLDQNSEGLAKDWEYIMYGKVRRLGDAAYARISLLIGHVCVS